MIKVVVEPYCDDCRDFTAEVVPPQRILEDNRTVHQTNTIIFCANADRCRGMVRYLEKKIEKKSEPRP